LGARLHLRRAHSERRLAVLDRRCQRVSSSVLLCLPLPSAIPIATAATPSAPPPSAASTGNTSRTVAVASPPCVRLRAATVMTAIAMTVARATSVAPPTMASNP